MKSRKTSARTASSDGRDDSTASVTARSLAHLEQVGRGPGMVSYVQEPALYPDYVGSIIEAAGVCPVIDAAEVCLAFSKLLIAYSKLQPSFTGFTDAKTITWLQGAVKRERSRARHYEKKEARVASYWLLPQKMETVCSEAHKLADRWELALIRALRETKAKQPSVLLMEPLAEFFEKVFGIPAAGGSTHGRPKKSDPCDGPLNQADSAFIRVALSFLDLVELPYKALTIQTALSDMRIKNPQLVGAKSKVKSIR